MTSLLFSFLLSFKDRILGVVRYMSASSNLTARYPSVWLELQMLLMLEASQSIFSNALIWIGPRVTYRFSFFNFMIHLRLDAIPSIALN